jgi:hypothetical protein
MSQTKNVLIYKTSSAPILLRSLPLRTSTFYGQNFVLLGELDTKQTRKQANDLIQDIRNLRESNTHVCPDDLFYKTEGREGEEGKCTCNDFDLIMDKIESYVDMSTVR